ncbi:MAG TPA: peptidylprolyl isomerase [Rhizomicrobium sp.]|jgi:peptidyl-prolyl cis-trans isomerase A (cyclophilin A)
MMRWIVGATAALMIAASSGAAQAEDARIETSLGNIIVELDRAHAPVTVANFEAYAKEGHFDGTCVYRVVPSFVIQMGSYDADGNMHPLHAPIALESANGVKNLRGTLSMARSEDPNSATGEFFINLSDNADLDPTAGAAPNATGYAVFGHVISGMDVVDRIAASVLNGRKGPFPDNAPAFPVVISKVTIEP